MKYTYSDDEDIFSDGLPSTRRSTRNTSGVSTPPEPSGPRYTASGRQIRSRAGGLYGETLLSGSRDELGPEEEGSSRPHRTRLTRGNGHSAYDLDDDMDGSDGAHSSGNEWQGGEEEEDNEFEGDDEEEMSGDESVVNGEPPSLVVQLRYTKGKALSSPSGPEGQTEILQSKPKPEETAQPPTQEQTGANGPDAGKEPAAADAQQSGVAPLSAASSQNLESKNSVDEQLKGAPILTQPPTVTDVPAHPSVTLSEPNETA